MGAVSLKEKLAGGVPVRNSRECPPPRIGTTTVPPPSNDCGIVVSQTDVGCPSTRDLDEVVTPTSLSGVVDAIVEVSRQRKVLLNQLRSALQSGNDAEALRFARHLCGLPG